MLIINQLRRINLRTSKIRSFFCCCYISHQFPFPLPLPLPFPLYFLHHSIPTLTLFPISLNFYSRPISYSHPIPINSHPIPTPFPSIPTPFPPHSHQFPLNITASKHLLDGANTQFPVTSIRFPANSKHPYTTRGSHTHTPTHTHTHTYTHRSHSIKHVRSHTFCLSAN